MKRRIFSGRRDGGDLPVAAEKNTDGRRRSLVGKNERGRMLT
jgi:hypothetical protein